MDDVVDVIIEDAEEAVLGPAGLLVDEDTFAQVRRGAVWLDIKLITALMALAVISLFEDTIVQVVALAVLMPVVASMGGISGTRTLNLVVQGQATGQLGGSNLLSLLNREFFVAAPNGRFRASKVALGAAYFF